MQPNATPTLDRHADDEQHRQAMEATLLNTLLSPAWSPACSIYDLEEEFTDQPLALAQAIESLKLIGVIHIDGAMLKPAGAARRTAELLQEI